MKGKLTGRLKPAKKKAAREPFSAADERWSLRRDLFYGMCNILEGCYTDPKLWSRPRDTHDRTKALDDLARDYRAKTED